MKTPSLTNSFYNFPLLIKHLLFSPLACNPEQEIVSGLNSKYNYKNSIIFIAGQPKSGSTLVINMLGQVPGYYSRYAPIPYDINVKQYR